MKTFEERYTAWIDGELEGAALIAFEQELVRRAAVEEARADKADAMRLNAFLMDHLRAPALTNPDFFNHQLRERIAGERAAAQRLAGTEHAATPASVPFFNWSFWRLAIGGAACLFIGGALYYGMIPKNAPGTPGAVAVQQSDTTPGQTAAGTSTAPAVSGDPAQRSSGPAQFAKLDREIQERLDQANERAADPQKKLATIEPGADIQATIPDRSVTTTVTPLHYKDPNVNVLWVNGLDYLPDTSALDAGTGTASAAPAASTAPAVTATP